MADQLVTSQCQQSQIVQQAILDSADFIIISTDRQGIIQTFNTGASRQLGYEPKEVIGQFTTCIFHDPQEIVHRAQQLSQDLGCPITPGYEVLVAKARLNIADENIWTYIRKDKSRFPVRLSVTTLQNGAGNLVGFLSISKDITGQQQAQRSLRESKACFAGAFQHAAIGMALVSPDGHWLKVNASLCEIVGYTESELLATTFQDITYPEDLKLDLQYVEQMLAGEISNYHIEKRYIHKQGHEVWILLSASLVHADDGQPLYFVAQMQDISQRKESEAAFQQLNADLEQLVQERTAQLENAIETAEIANGTKSQFLAHMSHELRTPLNAILGFSQLIAEDEMMPQHLQKSIDIINRSGEHLLSLINEVLTLSKIEAGQTILEETTFNFHDLLSSLHEMLHLQAQSKDLELKIEYSAEVPEYLHADEQKLRQVLINLMSNALKFTQQGAVTLRVRLDSQDLSSSSPTHSLYFELEDTGVGIAPDELETIFEPFVQTQAGQRMNQGTGLGLPICRSFIQLMGGTLTASSQIGKGTCFRFDVQVHVSEKNVTKKSSGGRLRDLSVQQPHYRILVVEDHLENQQLLVDLLVPLGYDVQAVADGQAAVSLSQNWHPHLIWMDINLPNMDGLKATQQIKSLASSENRSPPIIIALTASALDYTRSQALESGCDDFVSKPYILSDLLEIMTRYLKTQPSPGESQPLPDSQVSDNNRLYQQTPDQMERLPSQTTPDRMERLPSEWKRQLHQAALYLDEQRINSLIEQIEPEHHELASNLKTFVDNFQFDQILDLYKFHDSEI